MKKFEKMEIKNPHAAGIDIGSRSHFVAVGQEEADVQEFGVYASDQKKLISYLRDNKITSVAMESTGSYWPSLFSLIQAAGIEVILVNGYQTKNVRAKTDVKDCQWIQKLHSVGLLNGCFLPNEQTIRIRTLHRHRQSLVEDGARMTNKMQKSLRLMNLRLDVVISDIVGVTGRKIIEAILGGERDGKKLSLLADVRIQKSKEEIADALVGHWNNELLYELRDNYDTYQQIQKKIMLCDEKIKELLIEFTKTVPSDFEEKQVTKKK